MIVRERPGMVRLLFVVRGSVLPAVLPQLAVVFALSAAVTLFHWRHPEALRSLSPTPFTLVGIALSVFLGFRNSACYERWWEARRQWGVLLAEVRAALRGIAALLPEDPAARRRLGRRLGGFALALRGSLRGTAEDLAFWLPDGEPGTAANRPDAILRFQARDLAILLRGGALGEVPWGRLDAGLHALGGVQAACERLRGTPTPFGYTLLLHRTAWLFCLALPFGLVNTLGPATPLLCVLLAYAFFGLDALGDQLEAPFRPGNNTVPLDAIVRLVEIAVLDAEGVAKLPEPLEPRRFVLS